MSPNEMSPEETSTIYHSPFTNIYYLYSPIYTLLSILSYLYSKSAVGAFKALPDNTPNPLSP